MIPIKDDAPTATFPYVTVTIIAANVIVFIYQAALGRAQGEVFVLRAAAIPYEITHLLDIYPASFVPVPFTLLTAMFVHGGLFHLAGNMLFLWIFGDNIEDRLGRARFVAFYFLTGLVASLSHVVTEPSSTVPMVGASGAVAGVLGAYFLLFPRAQVNTLVFLVFFVTMIRVPAVLFLGLWFLMQVLGTGTTGAGIAWYAHIGGFAAGALLIMLFGGWKRRRRR